MSGANSRSVNVRRFLLIAAGVSISLSFGGAFVLPAQARGARNEKVESLIAAMTVDEKISMLRGGFPGVMGPAPSDPVGEAGYLPGVPRLGIQPMRLTDGPAGVRIGPPTTALPAPVALAATFSTDAARDYGRVLGREARANRQDVLYAPMMNIARVPQAGRNFETLGEDPFLTARLSVAQIEAVQGEGVIATAKHFAQNNQEYQRESINVVVDERTMHEVELPAFEASVKAGVGSVMCAYNKVNGRYACENPVLLTDILRRRWGFGGFVISDYGATHSAAPALKAGLEVEFLGNQFSALAEQVRDGTLPMAVLDEAARRILRTMDRFGMLASASANGASVVARSRPAMDVDGSARVARDVATQGAVLLKNDGALPLRRESLQSLVVIGPIAEKLLIGGGGSSRVLGFVEREMTQLDALRARAGAGARITYVTGIDLDGVVVPAAVLSPRGSPGQGLLRTDEKSGATQIDREINFVGDRALLPLSRVTWSGTLTVPATGEYELKLQGDKGIDPFGIPLGGSASLEVDGKVVAATTPFPSPHPTLSGLIPTRDGLSNASGRVTLTAGAHSITVRAGIPPAIPPGGAGNSTPVPLRLAWITPEMRRARIESAADAARGASAVVLFAYNEGTEGRDRESLSLPGRQDDLIAAVTAANRRTIVVLNTGDAVLMPWANAAGAILQMWYPGQEGSRATVDLLLGVANPGGKLPLTFPRREADSPTADPRRYPGIAGEQRYSEGVLVGYRWYDAKMIAPLFPFGHGLSYTRFAYSNLRVRAAGDGFDVTFTVRNTGAVRGAEVPQLYLGAPKNPPVTMAPRQLAGFTRVELDPGAMARVTMHIGARELSYWSVRRHDWTIARGARPILIGSSSRDIRLRGTTQ